MTDLEKQFMNTFGIEPRYEDACTVEDKYWNNEELANEYGTFDQYMNCKCGNQENCTTECPCAYQREVYPAISNRILLELICIINKFDTCFDYYYQEEYQVLRETILEDSINLDCKLKQTDFSKLKHQVQELFKEER